MSSIFMTSNENKKNYLQKFSKQLLIENEEELNSFNIHAMSILINSNLKPYMNSMNPTESYFDFTMGFSTMMDNSTFQEQHYLHM